ncbi:MAG: CRISPR-associated endonuclease Cas1 [Acidobacteria bacterium]|nr:CRISPR-associated endonuclease Cas1 [Acidobacteriota bacterium]
MTSLFSDRSFAYRPFLGPRRAAAFLRSNLPLAAWVVTADIEKFFDNVEHRVLAQQLRNVGLDEVGVRLILKWPLVPVDDRGRWYQPVKGLPRGSPVAPVLANLYLTGFDIALEAEGFTHVRYADDFVVLAPDEEEAQRGLRYVSTYLGSKLRLRIKPAKTQLAPADAGFTFVGFRFTRETWTVPTESVDRFKNEVINLLGEAGPRSLVDAAKSHNDVVRGWRNYYCGNSSEMDRQLSELDAWRSDQCAAYLKRAGKDPDAAPVWFERLIEHGDDRSPAGTYTGAPHEDGVVLSTTVMHECARRGIPIAVCSISGKPVARVVSARSPLDGPIVHHQLRARAGKSGTALVQAVVAAKLANQRALLLYHSKYRHRDANVRRRLTEAAGAIEEYLREVERVAGLPMRKARPQIFLTEARVAAHYGDQRASGSRRSYALMVSSGCSRMPAGRPSLWSHTTGSFARRDRDWPVRPTALCFSKSRHEAEGRLGG